MHLLWLWRFCLWLPRGFTRCYRHPRKISYIQHVTPRDSPWYPNKALAQLLCSVLQHWVEEDLSNTHHLYFFPSETLMSQPGNRMVTNATHNILRKKLKETKERMLSQDRHIPACFRRNNRANQKGILCINQQFESCKMLEKKDPIQSCKFCEMQKIQSMTTRSTSASQSADRSSGFLLPSLGAQSYVLEHHGPAPPVQIQHVKH